MAAIPTDFLWPRFPVGGLADLPFKNTTSATNFTPGQLVKLDTSNPMSAAQPCMGMVLTAAVADTPDGVVVQNTPFGGYGTMQILGMAPVIVDASGPITAGTLLGCSGTVNGAVTTYTATAGDGLVGKAVSTSVNTADFIEALLKLSTV
jgi:hypothetical protein